MWGPLWAREHLCWSHAQCRGPGLVDGWQKTAGLNAATQLGACHGCLCLSCRGDGSAPMCPRSPAASPLGHTGLKRLILAICSLVGPPPFPSRLTGHVPGARPGPRHPGHRAAHCQVDPDARGQRRGSASAGECGQPGGRAILRQPISVHLSDRHHDAKISCAQRADTKSQSLGLGGCVPGAQHNNFRHLLLHIPDPTLLQIERTRAE